MTTISWGAAADYANVIGLNNLDRGTDSTELHSLYDSSLVLFFLALIIQQAVK